jgi:hypothetical protein
MRRGAIHVGGTFQSVMEGFVDIELSVPPCRMPEYIPRYLELIKYPDWTSST